MLRWFAFHKVQDRPECGPYMRDSPEGRMLHTSVVDGAAAHPLNGSWEFETESFFQRVAELSALDPD